MNSKKLCGASQLLLVAVVCLNASMARTAVLPVTSGLKLFLDAEQGYSSAGGTTTWADQSGNGDNATTPNANAPATGVVTNWSNGRSALGFTHTSLDDADPCWQLDLCKPRPVAAVVVHNRRIQPIGRLRDITVTLLAEDGRTIVFESALLNPGNIESAGAKDTLCGPTQLNVEIPKSITKPVRYVRVKRTPCADWQGLDNQRVLSIADVEVFERVAQH